MERGGSCCLLKSSPRLVSHKQGMASLWRHHLHWSWKKSLAKSACSAPKPVLLQSPFCLPKNDKLALSQGLLGQAPQPARLALRGQTLLIRLRAMACIKIYSAGLANLSAEER
jgi:hypothetical protein